MRARRWMWIVMVGAVALTASACVRMRTEVVIASPESISVSMDIGLKTQALKAMGKTAQELCEGSGQSMPGNVSKEPYEEGEYSGCRISGTGPLAAGGGQLVTLADDVWTFTFALPTDTSDKLTVDQISDFRTSVTFPGEVLSHNGSSTVEGTTVVWTDPADLFAAEGLKATAKHESRPVAAPGDASGDDVGFMRWLPWVGAGVLALAVILTVFLVGRGMGRRKQKKAAEAQGQAWAGQAGPPQQYGPPGQYGPPAGPYGPPQQYGPPGQQPPQQYGQPYGAPAPQATAPQQGSPWAPPAQPPQQSMAPSPQPWQNEPGPASSQRTPVDPPDPWYDQNGYNYDPPPRDKS